MRQTHEWTDAELETLETWYVLRGSAFIRARHPHLSDNSIRQQASRLNLADDLREYTTLTDVAAEANVSRRALRYWIHRRPWAARHCRTWGPDLLIPLPVVRLYLPATRRATRPRGWIDTQQAAQRLNTTPKTIRQHCHAGTLTCTTARGVMYVDPHSIPSATPTTPAPDHVTLPALATVTGLHAAQVHRKVQTTGVVKGTTGRPAKVTSAHHARAFLTALGHRAEQVETLMRRAVSITVSGVK